MPGSRPSPSSTSRFSAAHGNVGCRPVPQNTDVDLIVWPDDVPLAAVTFSDDFQLPPAGTDTKDAIAASSSTNLVASFAWPPFEGRYPFLLGIDRAHSRPTTKITSTRLCSSIGTAGGGALRQDASGHVR